jgi:hypothetical protein
VTDNRATQVSIEQFATTNAPAQVTQVTVEQWAATMTVTELTGNLGGVSSYGKLAYGLKKYSRAAAFAPAFAANITVSAGVTFSGDLAPAVSFSSDLGVVWGLGGDLAPAVSFAADLSVAKLVNVAGDLQPQIDFAGDLSVDIALTALAGSFGFTIGFAGSDFTAGPLWAADQPCPSAWTASETCPPSLWTPDDGDPVAWEDSELCNG